MLDANKVTEEVLSTMDRAIERIDSDRKKIQLLREALADAVRWLDAIERWSGNHTLVNPMPNNCMGRNDMHRALEATK
jgi:hypothetical protein